MGTRDKFAYARFAAKGALTRLALCIDRDATYTGEQVQELLVAAAVAIEHTRYLNQENNSMSRDGKKNSAFASGMRGREKPKVADAHGSTKVPEGSAGNEKQHAGGVLGDPGGVDHTDPVYSSGMRGLEKGSQKPAAKDGGTAGTATFGQARGSSSGGENHQQANTMIGNPDGTDTSQRGARSGIQDAHMQSAAKGAHDIGIPGNNTENAAVGNDPIGAEEDDTHINIRVPKKSITKKKGAGQAV